MQQRQERMAEVSRAWQEEVRFLVESGGLLPLPAAERARYSELFGEAADGSVHTKHPAACSLAGVPM